jgi:hypothetical protein
LNPYLVLSETFGWFVGTLPTNLPDDIDGKWCELLLRFVNVPQQKQFTEDDLYGYFLNKLKDRPDSQRQIQVEFLNALSRYLSKIAETKIDIEWEQELTRFKDTKLVREQYKANSKTGVTWKKSEKISGLAIERLGKIQKTTSFLRIKKQKRDTRRLLKMSNQNPFPECKTCIATPFCPAYAGKVTLEQSD